MKNEDFKDEIIKHYQELREVEKEISKIERKKEGFEDRINFLKVKTAKIESELDYLNREVKEKRKKFKDSS